MKPESADHPLLKPAQKILDMGPHTLVIKRGEYGAMLFRRDSFFVVPGYLLEDVYDPTGAGDCFAGGFIGYLAKQGFDLKSEKVTLGELSRAVIYGSVMGSFCCERFGVERFRTLTQAEIDDRFKNFANSRLSKVIVFGGAMFIAAIVAFCAARWSFVHGYTLYDGDAEAHFNIARRILDSRTPGPEQIGTVWLPLTHILLVPFVMHSDWWQSGLAGAIPSAACFALAAIFPSPRPSEPLTLHPPPSPRCWSSC